MVEPVSNKLMKFSKVTAFKALGYIRSKPECVFAMLCNAEVSDRSDKESTEVKSARLAFRKTASSLHSKNSINPCNLSFFVESSEYSGT